MSKECVKCGVNICDGCVIRTLKEEVKHCEKCDANICLNCLGGRKYGQA